MSVLGSRPLPLADTPTTVLTAPDEAHEFAEVRAIFREYAASLEVDLCFQDFDRELAELPGDYAPPRGTVLLALVEPSASAAPPPDAPLLARPHAPAAYVAGCCALRPLDTVDYANAAEMKRLFVRPGFRGLGLGRQLVEAVLDVARAAGYACVLLDTLDDMESARALYEDLGFVEVPPYYHNPIAGSHYLKVEL